MNGTGTGHTSAAGGTLALASIGGQHRRNGATYTMLITPRIIAAKTGRIFQPRTS